MTEQKPDERLPNPNACRWCGVDKPSHNQRWAQEVKWHGWVMPTGEQRRQRMLARRTGRQAPESGPTDRLAS
jgi:hypothetical protein